MLIKKAEKTVQSDYTEQTYRTTIHKPRARLRKGVGDSNANNLARRRRAPTDTSHTPRDLNELP